MRLFCQEENRRNEVPSRSENLYSEIWNKVSNDGIPVLGTCAGAILLSQRGLINTEIERNAFGRQKESFQSQIQ